MDNDRRNSAALRNHEHIGSPDIDIGHGTDSFVFGSLLSDGDNDRFRNADRIYDILNVLHGND